MKQKETAPTTPAHKDDLLRAMASSFSKTASGTRMLEYELAAAERKHGIEIMLIAGEVAKQTPHDIFYWLGKSKSALLSTHRRLSVST